MSVHSGRSSLSEDQSNAMTSPSLTIALSSLLLVFFFLGFFTVYFCKCIMSSVLRNSHNGNPNNPQSSSNSQTNDGLDPKLINSFPTFPYSSIKDFRKENKKFELECAICLVEFEDLSFLRLLTSCCHVFHKECIDLWLQSHKTCPVCRRDLDSSSSSSPIHAQLNNNNNNNSSIQTRRPQQSSSLQDAISIDIHDDDDDDNESDETNSSFDSNKSKLGVGNKDDSMKKFSRSHSTGHSIVKRSGEDDDEEEEEDRYTLRLPEDIKIKLIRGHNWTGSCVSFEELCRHPDGINVGAPSGFVELTGSVSSQQINKH